MASIGQPISQFYLLLSLSCPCPVLFIPVLFVAAENQEGLQVLHYKDGQKYEPHFDYFHDQVNQRPEIGGQRLMTVLMYLTTPEDGGETVFPNADKKVTGPEWSTCAKQGLANKAIRGDAILFYRCVSFVNMACSACHSLGAVCAAHCVSFNLSSPVIGAHHHMSLSLI